MESKAYEALFVCVEHSKSCDTVYNLYMSEVPAGYARGRGKSRGGLGKYLRASGRGRGRGRGAVFTERLVLEDEETIELTEEEAQALQASQTQLTVYNLHTSDSAYVRLPQHSPSLRDAHLPVMQIDISSLSLVSNTTNTTPVLVIIHPSHKP